MTSETNSVRIIPRLDVKKEKLIKSVRLEGVRAVGDPNEFAKTYYEDGADELLYMDAVASLYGRNSLTSVIEQTAKGVFIPMAVGGGIQTSGDVEKILKSGADKVSINSAAVRKPTLINEISENFGSQSLVSQIDAKRVDNKKWEVLIDGGREKTGIDVTDWAEEISQRGAGEILLTSVDREGTKSGFDIDLVEKIISKSKIPVIASGGPGKIEDVIDCANNTGCKAFAIASILHFRYCTINEIKEAFSSHGYSVTSHF